MATVTCPSCGEKGKLPSNLVGTRIKCKKCSTSFFAGTPSRPQAAPSGSPTQTEPVAPRPDGIHVAGLDPAAWSATAVAAVEHDPEHEAVEPSSSFSASPAEVQPSSTAGPIKEYKVLTQKDKWFEGTFELARLEEALNHYARKGWTVRSMATPLVTGFSGGPREEIVVLLER